MKKMMTAVMALLLMAGTSASAQENKSVAPPRERPTTEQLARKATDRMTAQLKLTEKQAEQAYEATLERLQADEALREQARAAKMKEAEAMKSILSTEQFMRWSQMQSRPGRGHAPRVGKKAHAKGPECRPECGEAPKVRRENK